MEFRYQVYTSLTTLDRLLQYIYFTNNYLPPSIMLLNPSHNQKSSQEEEPGVRDRLLVDAHARAAIISTYPNGRKLVGEIYVNKHRPSPDIRILEADLQPYCNESIAQLTDPYYYAILKRTMDELKPTDPIIPLTLEGTLNHSLAAENLWRSAGLPWTQNGPMTREQLLKDPECRWDRAIIERSWSKMGRGKECQMPACVVSSWVNVSPKGKVRMEQVWEYPFNMAIEENRYCFPLMDHLAAHCNVNDSFYGLDMEPGLSGHSHIRRSLEHPLAVTAFDPKYTQFGANVPDWLIQDIFTHISSWFDFSVEESTTEGLYIEVKPIETWRKWKTMIKYFITVPIMTPSGVMTKRQGVPGGSMWSHLIETCANAIQTRYALHMLQKIRPIKDYYHGPNAIVILPYIPFFPDFSSMINTKFGTTVNQSKSSILRVSNTNQIKWLKYAIGSVQNAPYREFHSLISWVIFPEQEVTDSAQSCANILVVMWASLDPYEAAIYQTAVNYLMAENGVKRDDIYKYIRNPSPELRKHIQALGLLPEEIKILKVERCPTARVKKTNQELLQPSYRTYISDRERLPVVAGHDAPPRIWANPFLRLCEEELPEPRRLSKSNHARWC